MNVTYYILDANGIHKSDDGYWALRKDYDALLAENERLAKDAARYRWLRDVEEPVASEVARRFLWLTNDAFDEFVDAAIDAALAGKP